MIRAHAGPVIPFLACQVREFSLDDARFTDHIQGTFGRLCRSRDSNADALAGTGF